MVKLLANVRREEKIMKKIQKDKTSRTVVAETRDEYHLDYAKARPNRFADRIVESDS
jgi:hypothetical protein